MKKALLHECPAWAVKVTVVKCPGKCESTEKMNREIQWKMVCESLNRKSMESTAMAVAGGSGRASWKRVGYVSMVLSSVLGGGCCAGPSTAAQ